MKKESSKFSNWLDKKGTQLLYVINLIGLILIITHGGLTLILQSMLPIPC